MGFQKLKGCEYTGAKIVGSKIKVARKLKLKWKMSTIVFF